MMLDGAVVHPLEELWPNRPLGVGMLHCEAGERHSDLAKSVARRGAYYRIEQQMVPSLEPFLHPSLVRPQPRNALHQIGLVRHCVEDATSCRQAHAGDLAYSIELLLMPYHI